MDVYMLFFAYNCAIIYMEHHYSIIEYIKIQTAPCLPFIGWLPSLGLACRFSN